MDDGASVRFTWENPDPQDGDRYAWEVVDPLEDGLPTFVDEPTVTVPADASGRTCLRVSIVREGRGSADPAGVCVEGAS
ncbi:hypothetical protein GCM10025865_05550 [Paraoerskovia sediminicola]|uniref:Uncharacterized protein n=1 Tax=Paraoerskovia sediminicola TaxID=1138587 RepID=A0ABM8FZQ6_9CELL|nr:hypothetical protein [Paraoerskovia sediminicola]BDZ41256.1 hypothetical protein GCM10025865_05550 [Paraoerskovia sediminicola]